MFKIVKSAQIEVIKPSELKIGDYILWYNLKVKVVKINKLNRSITVLNPFNNIEEGHLFVLNYYRIVDCEEIESKE